MFFRSNLSEITAVQKIKAQGLFKHLYWENGHDPRIKCTLSKFTENTELCDVADML